jgi:hypothetical protein
MIFICGPHSSGKTVLARELERQGYLCLELGKIMREIYADSGNKSDFHDWSVAIEEERGEDYINKLIVSKLNRKCSNMFCNRTDRLAIVGARSVGVIDAIKACGVGTERSMVVYVDSAYEMMKSLYSKREGIYVSDVMFKALLRNDEVLGLSQIKKMADVTILNNGTLEEFITNSVSIIKNRGLLKCKQ